MKNRGWILTLGVLLLVPVTVFLALTVTHFFSGAFGSPSIAIEAENGSLSGDVAIASDSQASTGKFIEFGGVPVSTPVPSVSPRPSATPSSISFQPKPPYYASFYYMWYKNPSTDGGWSYWSDNHLNPPTTWFSNYMPETGLYSSNDYNNFKWQVSQMAKARLSVAIASWWGQGTREDTAYNNIINSFMPKSDNPYPNLRWAIYYEKEGFGDPSVVELTSDLNYLKNKYAGSPYALRVNGKPVIFVYAGATDNPGTMTSRWKEANAATGNYFYINLKVFSGFANDPNQPDSWHQYAPATRGGTFPPYSSYASPGFWLVGNTERLARSTTDFDTAVKTMVSSNTIWKLVETWNEWGEGTSIEPSKQFGSDYINILANDLPQLQAGTGAGNQPPPSLNPIPTPTPITGGPSVTVAAVGDISCGTASIGAACQQSATADLVSGMNPNAVLLLGDVQYENGSYFDFINFYDKSWGKFKNITFPSIGNHEYLTPGGQGYYDYFNGVGVNSGAAGDRSKGYYAFNLGSWRLYALNSNCSEVGGCQAGSPQETWLKNDLATNPHQCVLAYFHHPMFASGSLISTQVRPLWQDLYNAGAELILNGHEHSYERFAAQDPNGNPDPKGIIEIVAGMGGRNFTGFLPSAANSIVKNNKTFGVLKLILTSVGYSVDFVPVSGSTFTDSISANCH